MRFTTNVNLVEQHPFSAPTLSGKEILVFFSNPFKFGFGFKIRKVIKDTLNFKSLRFKFYGLKHLPFVYSNETYQIKDNKRVLDKKIKQ